jgi:mannosidase alpha-like ER degradation enhancer 2
MKQFIYFIGIFSFVAVSFLFANSTDAINVNGKQQSSQNAEEKRFDKNELNYYKDKVKQMFYHAYDNYIYNAYPYDELKPLTCKGFDTWGSYSLTLIDSLDMLIILGNRTEFERVVDLLKTTLDFDKDINVSVFETNIRVIGGLLSAHLLSYRLYYSEDSNVLNVQKNATKLHSEWPCAGSLLNLAISAAKKLLPAFDTPTGLPYGTVNLKYGVPQQETTETCVAGTGTFIVEFGALSRLTGDPAYELAARRALDALWERRSPLDLVGNHIRVDTGKWSGNDATIGSGVDSYFEYLVKGGILLNDPSLIKQFRTYQRAIDSYLYHDSNWFLWANMNTGQKTLPLFSSLEAFYPGLLTLVGNLAQATKLLDSYHTVWRQYGSLPEFLNIQSNTIHSNRESYPLRPELIESLMYVLKATQNDGKYFEMAVDYLESIERISRIKCGFATVKDIKDHKLEDRMESFFLAETLKYLYLIFDVDNFLHNDISSSLFKVVKNDLGECLIETGYFFFNTEAHPVDGAALECCRILRDKTKTKDLDFDKLVDQYVKLKSTKSPATVDDNSGKKSMKQEYQEIKANMLLKSEKIELCADSKVKSNVTLNKVKINYFPLSCSLDDSFEIHTSLLNNFNFYP